MSAETLRRAASEISDEWSENRAMGQDRNEWLFYRAVADWLDGVALHLEARADEEWFDLDGDPISPEDTHAIGSALAVARAYLGEQA